MLDGNVLVLNRLFQPIQVTSVRRAITLFYKGDVHAVDVRVPGARPATANVVDAIAARRCRRLATQPRH